MTSLFSKSAQLLCTAERELQSRKSFEFMLKVGARHVVPECKYLAISGILGLTEAESGFHVKFHFQAMNPQREWVDRRVQRRCSLPYWHHLGHTLCSTLWRG